MHKNALFLLKTCENRQALGLRPQNPDGLRQLGAQASATHPLLPLRNPGYAIASA